MLSWRRCHHLISWQYLRERRCSVALNIIKSITNSFDFGKGTVRISASIGIAIYPQDGEDIASLINRADRAMYIAKDSGKSRFHFLDQS